MMQEKSIFFKVLKFWLPVAVATVVLSGLVYVAVQQNYRMSANDPQIQIAEDVADAIATGAAAPQNIVPPTGTTDIGKSLATFVMIYDDSNKLIGSSAILDGKNPSYPTGVFDSMKKANKMESSTTWQPKTGLRFATVAVRYTSTAASGYLVVGRSLREVEVRISNLTMMTAAATAFSLLVTFLIVWLMIKMSMAKKDEAPAPMDSDHHHHPHTA